MKKAATFILVSTCLFSAGSFAEVRIQSAQYNDNKGSVFIKGKSDHSTVYVVNAATEVQIGTITATRGQFKADLSVSAEAVPCSIRVQSNAPGTASSMWDSSSLWDQPAAASDPGETDQSRVRHAPSNCN